MGMDYWNLTLHFVHDDVKMEAYHVLMPVSSSEGSNHEGIHLDALHWYLGSMSPKALTMGIFRLFYPSLHSLLYYEAV